ncbi:MAG: SGNH/GDSL hydrolase family protein [Candidatus Eisenbacteria bacterium]|nr:SGNH/GDSL hydrolase family protein [Candidatus Eisenbacteria bacterium]
MRFLALGDSYTIGEGVPEAERWPVQLAVRLRERGAAIGAPEIIARTGWTTDELSAAIGTAAPGGRYALVTLMIGVNNQFRGRDLDEYRRQFQALLTQAVGFAGSEPSRVLVLSIPDWGVTPFAAGRDRGRIAADIDRFNAVALEETDSAGARYIDVTPISREAAHDSSLIAPDGLHPSGRMYARWVDVAMEPAMEAFEGGAR